MAVNPLILSEFQAIQITEVLRGLKHRRLLHLLIRETNEVSDSSNFHRQVRPIVVEKGEPEHMARIKKSWNFGILEFQGFLIPGLSSRFLLREGKDVGFGDRILDLSHHMRMAGKEKDLVCCTQVTDGFEGRAAATGVKVDEDIIENDG
jgi:hypothetical protein